MKYVFFVILLIPYFVLSEQRDSSQVKEQQAKKNNNITEKPKLSDSAVSKKPKKSSTVEVKKSCKLKGERRLYSEKHTIYQDWNFSSQITKLVDKHIAFTKKPLPQECPSYCKQINDYKVVSQLRSLNVEQGSCPEKQAKEIYSFKKEFPFKKKEKSIKKAHKNMVDWIFDTFMYPYFSIPFFQPSKEFTENNLEKACPSCSFYFDYSYKHTKDNKLVLDISAKCGDMKKFLSNFKAEFVLLNRWSCQSKEL